MATNAHGAAWHEHRPGAAAPEARIRTNSDFVIVGAPAPPRPQAKPGHHVRRAPLATAQSKLLAPQPACPSSMRKASRASADLRCVLKPCEARRTGGVDHQVADDA